MTIGFGRRRLVLNYLVEQSTPSRNRFLAAEQASELELARMQSQRDALRDRMRWEVNAPLYGVGYPR